MPVLRHLLFPQMVVNLWEVKSPKYAVLNDIERTQGSFHILHYTFKAICVSADSGRPDREAMKQPIKKKQHLNHSVLFIDVRERIGSYSGKTFSIWNGRSMIVSGPVLSSWSLLKKCANK